MIARLITLWATIWVLLAAPTLCMGGVLLHLCACAAAAVCGAEDACGQGDAPGNVDAPGYADAHSREGAHGHADAPSHEGAHGHEDACTVDPCPDALQIVDAQKVRLGTDLQTVFHLPSQFLLEHMLPRTVMVLPQRPLLSAEVHPLQRLRPLLI